MNIQKPYINLSIAKVTYFLAVDIAVLTIHKRRDIMGTATVVTHKNIDPHHPDKLSSKAHDTVIAALKAATNSGRLDVRGVMGLQDSVAKFDTLTFDDGATLMFQAIDAEFIAVAVKELILDIKNPQFRAVISRPVGALEAAILSKLNGTQGQAGSSGTNGGEVNRVGQPGGHGTAGTDGGSGMAKNIPPVYFFVQNFKFGNQATPSKQYLYMNFAGFPGGNGGNGGGGGSGGRGGDGKAGASGLFGCDEGGGTGGNGGNAGSGGRGGDAGPGGNGGTLYLFAPDSTLFDFSTATIEGADPGIPGHGGTPGNPGRGGSGAASNGFCGSKQNGRGGRAATPATLGDGATALKGNRGLQIIKNRDNKDLF